MRNPARTRRYRSGGLGPVRGAELRRRLRWWLRACRGLAAVILTVVIAGLLLSFWTPAAYLVALDLGPANGPGPSDRLSVLLERELERLDADEVTVVADATGDGVGPGACATGTVTARFRLPRGAASAFFGTLPVLSEQAGAPLCGWGYRQEHDVRTVRTLAVASGMPIVALVLALLVLRGAIPTGRPMSGILPGIGPALRLGTATGALCLLLAFSVVPAMVRLGVPMDTFGELRIAGPEELLWFAVLMVLCAPLVEEYAFRLRFLDAARRAVGPGIALVLSASAFAAFHVPGTFGTFTVYWAIGMVLGVLWMRSRSLLACCTAHATYNAALLAWSVGTLA